MINHHFGMLAVRRAAAFMLANVFLSCGPHLLVRMDHYMSIRRIILSFMGWQADMPPLQAMAADG